jgi:hypothetical protein
MQKPFHTTHRGQRVVLRCCTNARWQRHLPDRGCM